MDAQRESGREERLFDKSLVWSTLETYQRLRDAALALDSAAGSPEAPLPLNPLLVTQFELGRSRRAVLSFALRQYAESLGWTEGRIVRFLNLIKKETLAAFVQENPLIPRPNPRIFDVAMVFDMVLSTAPGAAVPVAYVASPNYLLRGPRYDSCEVSLGAVIDGREWAVRLICFFMCDLGKYAVVQFYEITSLVNPIDQLLAVYKMALMPDAEEDTYGVVPIEALQCHAHLVPNWDTPDEYYWDKPQDGRVKWDGEPDEAEPGDRGRGRRRGPVRGRERGRGCVRGAGARGGAFPTAAATAAAGVAHAIGRQRTRDDGISLEDRARVARAIARGNHQ
jgi:hypothetical protein